MIKIQQIRKEKGLSQSQLAKISGVPVRVLQTYERGARNIDGANLDRLCDVAIALEVNLWDILESTELVDKIRKCT